MVSWRDSKLFWPTHQGTFLGCRLARLAAHREESAVWVKSRRSSFTIYCVSARVGLRGWKPDRLHMLFLTQHTESSPKDAAWFFLFSLHVCSKKKKKKAGSVASGHCGNVIGVTDATEWLHSKLQWLAAILGEGKDREMERNLVCGSVRGCQGVGHPLVQKSRCRSLPKKFKNPDVLAKREAPKPSPCK